MSVPAYLEGLHSQVRQVRQFNHYALRPCYKFCADKLLVSTGYPKRRSLENNVIDLKSDDKECDYITDEEFPVTIEAATGALMEKKTPVICGGYDDSYTDKCYALGDGKAEEEEEEAQPTETKMLEQRAHAASILIGDSDDQLFIVGGFSNREMNLDLPK